MGGSYSGLSAEEVEQFVTRGWVRLDDCFERQVAERWVAEAFARAGIDPAQPSTWPRQLLFLGQQFGIKHVYDVARFAPKVWDACCRLLGGAERIDGPWLQNDGFIVNAPDPAGAKASLPDAESNGWHVDGDFNHFLDSPELGLLTVWLWSDVAADGGATYIAPEALGPIARALLAHPEGLSAKALRLDYRFGRECRTFVPLCGPIGTVYLMHPLMLHSASGNRSTKLRLIRNGAPSLREPLRFDRSDPAAFSPLERATLHALGVERLDYQPPPPERRHPTDHDTGAPKPKPERPSRSKRLAQVTE